MQFGYIPISCDVFIMSACARGRVRLQNQSVFLSVRVLFKMEPERHAGLRGCRRPLFEFGWVKRWVLSAWPRSLLQYSTQLSRLIRLSPALLWQSLKLHWLGQTNPLLCITKTLIQVHHLDSTEWGCHLFISAKLYIHLFFLFKFSVSLCAALLPAFRNEKDKSTARLLLLVRYCRCSLWPSWGQRIWR